MTSSTLQPSIGRRQLLKGASALAGVASMGMPALSFAQNKPIRVGMPTILSGRVAMLGLASSYAAKMEVEKFNAAGGLNGRKIELIAEDDGYDPTRTLAAAKKLAEQDKVLALVAPTGTPNVAALVQYATERKLPILSPYAFSNTLTTPTTPTPTPTAGPINYTAIAASDGIGFGSSKVCLPFEDCEGTGYVQILRRRHPRQLLMYHHRHRHHLHKWLKRRRSKCL